MKASQDFSEISLYEVILIAVSTDLKEDGSADLVSLVETAKSLVPYLNSNHLIIVKSTVPPLTTEKVLSPILNSKWEMNIAYCPERISERNALTEIKNIPVIVGSDCLKSLQRAKDFWKKTLGVPVIPMKNTRSAELVKLACNAWAL